MPAVKEVLGCLIPASLDPELDGVKPKGKAKASGGPGGVCLLAGRWQLDVTQERDLGGETALSKGMLEFLLIVLRQVCEELELPVLVGSHAVGELVGSIGSVAELLERVRAFPTWMRTERDLGRMEEFLPLSYTHLTLPTICTV